MTQPADVQTSHPERKLGRRERHYNRATHPRLSLNAYLRAGYTGTVPTTVDYSADVPFTMALNDQLGDCTAADYCHSIQLWTKFGGHVFQPTDNDVVAFYEGSTGYNPQDPSTDQGGNLQDVCNYARKVGMSGHRINAFFEVDPSQEDQLRAALYLFGCVSIGMSFPAFAMDQFNNGRPWDVSRANPKIEGGHDVLLVGMVKGANYKVVTWGKVQEVTPAFWRRYMAGHDGEAWVRASPDWIASGKAGNGLRIADVNAAYTALTGQPGPFPETGPVPAPAPVPSPIPPVVPPSALHDIADALAILLARIRALL